MKQEEVYINGRKFYKTTPEDGYLLYREGVTGGFEEAYDLVKRDYYETEIIKEEEVSETNE